MLVEFDCDALVTFIKAHPHTSTRIEQHKYGKTRTWSLNTISVVQGINDKTGHLLSTTIKVEGHEPLTKLAYDWPEGQSKVLAAARRELGPSLGLVLAIDDSRLKSKPRTDYFAYLLRVDEVQGQMEAHGEAIFHDQTIRPCGNGYTVTGHDQYVTVEEAMTAIESGATA